MIKSGDCIRVKRGVLCPDLQELQLEGWQGHVLHTFHRGENQSATLEIIWDSETLRSMPWWYVLSCEQDGLDWSSIFLWENEVHLVQPRDSLDEVSRVHSELERRLAHENITWEQNKTTGEPPENSEERFVVPIQIVRSMTSMQTFLHGEALFSVGAVERCHFSDGVYRAVVKGQRKFLVEVWGGKSQVFTYCFCSPTADELCEHRVATLLAIQAHGGLDFSEEKEKAPELPNELSTLVDQLSEAQLRQFVKQQLSQNVLSGEDFRIFSLGNQPTPLSVLDLETQISTDLQSFVDLHERQSPQPSNGGHSDLASTLREYLHPYLLKIEKYSSQENWLEVAKFYTALVDACGKRGFPDTQDSGEENRKLTSPYLIELFRNETLSLLEQWAIFLSTLPSFSDKLRALKPFVVMFVFDPFSFPALVWNRLFRLLEPSPREARSILELIWGIASQRFDQSHGKAEVLLYLLEHTDEHERFIRIGKRMSKTSPGVALQVSRKLHQLGRTAEALQTVENVLPIERDTMLFELSMQHWGLALRFWVTHYTLSDDFMLWKERGIKLLQYFERLDDYELLIERCPEKLLLSLKEDIAKYCSLSFLLGVYSKENALGDLLFALSLHHDSPAFYRGIAMVRQAAPEDSFSLYTEHILGMTKRLKGYDLERALSFHLKELQKIPLHDEAFSGFLSELRANGLSVELLELALGQDSGSFDSSLDGVHTNYYEEFDSIDELLEKCPIQSEDKARLKGTTVMWQPTNAALVWAILKKNGGQMKADDLTEAIISYRDCLPSSAGTMRSSGLRVLEVLGHVEVVRQGKRVVEMSLRSS